MSLQLPAYFLLNSPASFFLLKLANYFDTSLEHNLVLQYKLRTQFCFAGEQSKLILFSISLNENYLDFCISFQNRNKFLSSGRNDLCRSIFRVGLLMLEYMQEWACCVCILSVKSLGSRILPNVCKCLKLFFFPVVINKKDDSINS